MHVESAQRILRQQLTDATIKSKEASARFEEAVAAVPSGLPDPDGVQHLHNVSKEYAAARQKVVDAMTRLNDFAVHGIIPDDLK